MSSSDTTTTLTDCSGARLLKIHSLHTTANKLLKKIQHVERKPYQPWLVFLILIHPDRIGGLVFVEEGKPENPKKNSPSKTRTNHKLNPHMAPGWNRTRVTLVGGERSHHCAIPALQNCLGVTSRIEGPSLLPKHTCSGIPTVHC